MVSSQGMAFIPKKGAPLPMPEIPRRYSRLPTKTSVDFNGGLSTKKKAQLLSKSHRYG